MDTLLTRSAEEAAAIIKRGGTVAFPTETVYGLGADVFDERAVLKIFEAKRRPADNPLIAHIGDTQQVRTLAREVTAEAQRFIAAFFPGPLTVVLLKSPRVPLAATAGLDTIGVRMPRNATSRAFLMACGTPVVAPSANLSGRPSPTTWQAVYEDLDGRIDCILHGEATEIGLESTVVDCTTETPLVLRSGAVSIDELQQVIPSTRLHISAPGEQPRSPGLKHRHYSPNAVVRLLEADAKPPDAASSAYIGLARPQARFLLERICPTVTEYAHELFEFFRECDRRGIASIYCQVVPAAGIGTALMDRLRRAAAR